MSLLEWDEVEKKIEKKVQDMDASDLVEYTTVWYQRLFSYPYPVDWGKDVSIMKRFVKAYGKDAGYILKYLFHYQDGTRKTRGPEREKFKFAWLSSGMRYWSDGVYDKVKEIKLKERKAMKEAILNPTPKQPEPGEHEVRRASKGKKVRTGPTLEERRVDTDSPYLSALEILRRG